MASFTCFTYKHKLPMRRSYQRLLNFSRRISPSSRCCSRTAAATTPPRSSFWARRFLHTRGWQSVQS